MGKLSHPVRLEDMVSPGAQLFFPQRSTQYLDMRLPQCPPLTGAETETHAPVDLSLPLKSLFGTFTDNAPLKDYVPYSMVRSSRKRATRTPLLWAPRPRCPKALGHPPQHSVAADGGMMVGRWMRRDVMTSTQTLTGSNGNSLRRRPRCWEGVERDGLRPGHVMPERANGRIFHTASEALRGFFGGC